MKKKSKKNILNFFKNKIDIINNFFKNKNKGKTVLGIYYDYKSGACDFILKTPKGNLAVEVGWGKKTHLK